MEAKKYYYDHEPEGKRIERTGILVAVERNCLNPLVGRTFVSIAFYDVSGEIVGIVF